MRLEDTNKILNKFAKYVVQQAKSNLTREKKNVTKELYNSIDYRINQYKDSIDLLFTRFFLNITSSNDIYNTMMMDYFEGRRKTMPTAEEIAKREMDSSTKARRVNTPEAIQQVAQAISTPNSLSSTPLWQEKL